MKDEKIKELCKEYEEEIKEREEKFKAHLSEKQQWFIWEVNTISRYDWKVTSDYTKELFDGLKSGKYKKPSEFMKKKMGWLFDGYILPRFKDALLYAMDNCKNWPYSSSYYRRPFRKDTYYMDNLIRIIKSFHDALVMDYSITDILSLNLPEKERAYFLKNSSSWLLRGYNAEVLAYELSQENHLLEDILTDIINGDGEVVIHRSMIKGIVRCDNEKMHALLGRLLLAARLQEGLRQVICENMDMGNVSAYLYLLQVIKDNNLIRYSAVKRAVGTWLGLIAAESGDLERISDKSIELILYCLSDKEHIEEYLQTEDSMKIYVALWAIGVYDASEAIERVYKLSEEGTHHQILTAGYFCANLNNSHLAHVLAKSVIDKYSKEYDILAVYMEYFIGDWRQYRLRGKKKDRTYPLLEDYFEDREEAESYYRLMWEIYNDIPKKKLEFSPCIFSWYTAALTKSQIIVRLCLIAKMLEDNEKIDTVCNLLKECTTDSRSSCLSYLLEEPATKLQKAAVVAMLCDKQSWTRDVAKDIVEEMEIADENYLQMEEMLKYKAADMRSMLITFLMKQEDDKLEGTVERLLSDKKEEKRTAGLDIVMQIAEKPEKKVLFDTCVTYVKAMENPSAKENILIGNIMGNASGESAEEDADSLYQEEDAYVPDIKETEFIRKSVDVFMEYFPDSGLRDEIAGKRKKDGILETAKGLLNGTGKACRSLEGVKADCDSLHKLFEEHKEDEFKGYGGEIHTLGTSVTNFRERITDFEFEVPYLSLWKEWYEKEIKDVKRLYRMQVFLNARETIEDYQKAMQPYIRLIFGAGFEKRGDYSFSSQMRDIVERLLKDYMQKEDRMPLSVSLAYWYLTCLPQDKVLIPAVPPANSYDREQEAHFITHSQLCSIFADITCKNNPDFDEMFPLAVKVGQKTFEREVKRAEAKNERGFTWAPSHRYHLAYPYRWGRWHGYSRPGVHVYLIAAFREIITKEGMYEYLYRAENIESTISTVTTLVMAIREQGRQVAQRGNFPTWRWRRSKDALALLLGRSDEEIAENAFTDEEKALLIFVEEVYETIISRILAKELRRGDSETIYSRHISKVARIYGMDNFIAILSAMGKDTLARSTWSQSESKKGCLSHLLSVCIPNEDDNADRLKGALKGTDITEKRLIEASLYSPEWMGIVGEYLGWEGYQSACYYFMAHMNESFDGARKAMIARYTPLSEGELNLGAFDINWFRSAYETLGKKRFDLIYDAAKYISDGSKHARARKYADAVLGKMDRKKTEAAISDKRNKDLLMAYTLIPLKGEDDIAGRYLFLQEFVKQSRQFGAQRIASEKAAAEIAMSNLATNAGYSDVTRLTLRMEAKLIADIRYLFEEKEIEDVKVRLLVDEMGKTDISCIKNGKALKSIPAKLKKNEHIVLLKETKKKLTEQFRRTKLMFEQAMEDGTEFKVSEILLLHDNPVVCPIVKNLLFVWDGHIGFLADNKLTDYEGKQIKVSDDADVFVAHPFHIYKDGHWPLYQQHMFDNKIVQNFKQVFRELYVKTEEELSMDYSRRYSGNQIQPKKTVACLKQRRWVADIEDGLQKVYYKENIVARIYAMADWFTPADIEAPTLEWVEFSDRKTGERIQISKIPDVIFSEVMRDVDLAVSVAHAGGVDPETSHSTVEMRAALLTFTLPLFKIGNVKINKNHAIIEGHYGTYTVNLGSGVIHKQGGTMINVLPVHSQHRGKLFLPFADDDPKTAEILTKVIMFAEDKKIKDPTILEQIG